MARLRDEQNSKRFAKKQSKNNKYFANATGSRPEQPPRPARPHAGAAEPGGKQLEEQNQNAAENQNAARVVCDVGITKDEEHSAAHGQWRSRVVWPNRGAQHGKRLKTTRASVMTMRWAMMTRSGIGKPARRIGGDRQPG